MRRFLVSSTLLAVAAANGQTWVNPVSGNWNTAANWTPANVPDTSGETANISVAGTYTIDFNLGATIGGMALTNANATVNVPPNTHMGIGALPWTNNGLLVVNSTGANLTTQFRTDVGGPTIGGTGTVRFNANPANLDTAQANTLNGGFVLTNAAGHRLAGTGRIRVSLVNAGLVDADVLGSTLDLTQFGKSNSGTMRATNGGTLSISAITLDNTGGQVLADGAGSLVAVNSSGMTSGTLSATNGGLTSTSNSVYTNVTFAGPHHLNANTVLGIAGGGITNNGTLTVNPNGDNLTTQFRTDAAAVTVGGSGLVRLNANAANLDTAQMNTVNGGFVLTNGANQTIAGTGRIRVNTINEGFIRADVAGATLDLTQFNKSNNNLMEAVGDGHLLISGITLTNGVNGRIRADGAGSLVSYASSGFIGGLLTAVNGGLGQISGTTTFRDLTVSGPHEVVSNNVLGVQADGFTNNGLITVNHDGANLTTQLRTDAANVEIDGTGTIHLNAHPDNLDTAQMNAVNGGFAMTLGANQTVEGTGSIRVLTVNNGLIEADLTGRTLALRQFAKTNNGTMQAINGGILSLEGVTVSNSSGQIRADGAGSAVGYGSSGITGGTLVATNGGLGSIANSTFSDLTVTGPHQVNSNSVLAINGTGITNNGQITVNHDAGNLSTQFRTDTAAVTIGGTGTIRLNAHPENLDTAQLNPINGNFVMTLGANQTVHGTGSIRTNTINNGLIDADQTGRVIALRQFPKANNGTMRARNGGTLSIEAIPVANANGQIVADGAGSVVGYGSSGITGGLLSAVNGGLGSIANSTFSDLTLSGPHQVNSNSVLAIAGNGFTNNGLLTVNHDGANLNTQFRVDVATATLGGSGTVHLNANLANLDTAFLSTLNGGFALTIGPAQSVTGNGAIRVITTLEGTLSPGSTASPVGRVEQRQFAMTMAPSATFEVDLAGLAAGQFDTFGSVGAVTLDGTLEVHIASGFVPVLGDEFVIVTAATRSGTFEQVVTPNPGPNNAWRVRYEPTRAVLTVTCPPDIDGDHTVSLQDLAVLLAHFGMQSGAQGHDGDLDGDGDVELQDLAALLATFGTNCP